MRLAYITAQFPCSKGESFLISEARELLRRGTDLFIIPIHPTREVPADRKDLEPCSISLPMLSPNMTSSALRSASSAPLASAANWWNATAHGTAIARLKNLVTYPKALWLAEVIRRNRIEHIHALWASTSATAAMVASDLTRVPFSFSAHRGDLESPNILGAKAERAQFIRCISEDGRRCAVGIAGERYASKMIVTHLGVNVPESNCYAPLDATPAIGLCPAALIPRKGQIYLLGALRRLLKDGYKVRIRFAGRGPDEASLKRQAADLMRQGAVEFMGHLSHVDLLAMYRRQEIAFVVLPSLHEGIPVALMEAMAHGVPTISTDVGGTGELLRDGAGVLVPPKDEEALRGAIARLLDHVPERAALSRLGFQRVREEFDIVKTTATLEALCELHSFRRRDLTVPAVA